MGSTGSSRNKLNSASLADEVLATSREHAPRDPDAPVRGVSATRGVVAAVGSANPVKVRCTHEAFLEAYDGPVFVQSVPVASGVSDQPMNTEETLRGAIWRASRAARTANADFGVGLEGGLAKIAGNWYCIGWVAVVDWTEQVWSACTAGVPVPGDVMNLILHNGLELGDAEDRVFGRINSKQTGGLIGIITEDRITRAENFLQPLVTAICAMQMDRRASRV